MLLIWKILLRWLERLASRVNYMFHAEHLKMLTYTYKIVWQYNLIHELFRKINFKTFLYLKKLNMLLLTNSTMDSCLFGFLSFLKLQRE